MGASVEEDEENSLTMKQPIHLLIIPFPASGHIIPLLDLTDKLLTNHHHLSITFLVTPPFLPLLQPLLSTYGSSQLQALVLSPTSPSPERGIISKIRASQTLSEPIVSWYHSHPSPPHVLISDFFLGWTHTLAVNLGFPRVVFYPSGAFAISVWNSMWSKVPEQPEGIDSSDFRVQFDDVPGLPSFKWSELSQLFRSGKWGDQEWELFRGELLNNLLSWGAVFNTFSEFESVYIDHIKKTMGHDRVWSVGPLLPQDTESVAQRGGSSSVPVHEVLTWLDEKTDSSVVYICFGSRTSLTTPEAEALKAALEFSKVQFIWCIRGSEGEEGIIPDSSYENHMAGRGFIIRGWAPQLAILKHRAVAAFLTHCGWNSILESVSTGVVILAWPMGADQYSNAQLVVRQLRLGLQVQCHGPDGLPNADVLARLLLDSVTQNQPEKGRVTKLHKAADTAVRGGSSTVDLEKFVQSLSELSN